MKIRNLAILFVIGLFAASCTDKKAQEEIMKLKEDMAAADSLCQADKAMLMDSIAKIMEEMTPPNKTSSGSGTKGSTTTTTEDKTVDTDGGKKDVLDRGGTKVVDKDVNDRGGSEDKVIKKDVNKRGGN